MKFRSDKFTKREKMKWWIRDKIWQIKHWWEWRWFRRNQTKLRNIAAWAIQHEANGGIHYRESILAGCADRRIFDAAYGRIE